MMGGMKHELARNQPYFMRAVKWGVDPSGGYYL